MGVDMKNIFSLLFFVLGLFYLQDAQGQISVSVNIGSQPMWGPVGYDYVRYYYMPEMEVYYDVHSRKYTYWQGNKWVTKSKLPGKYKKYNVYRTYKVVINDQKPWHKHPQYKNKYAHYAHNHGQVVLRDKKSKGHQVGKKKKNNGNRKHHAKRHY